MMRADASSTGVRSFAKRISLAGRNCFDVLLRERPTRLDRIQVRRVRRQELEPSAAAFDQFDDALVLVRPRVVEDHDVSEVQLRDEAFADPASKTPAVRRREDRSKRDPAAQAQCADHRHAGAPVHRTWVVQFFAATDPRMRATHREVRRSFIDENEARRVHSSQSSEESSALSLDVGPVLLRRTYAFFLNTKPARRSAR